MTAIDAQRHLASLSLAVVVIGADASVISANPAAEHLFGRSFRRLQGTKLDELLQFDDQRLAERMKRPDAVLSARAAMARFQGRVGAFPVDLTLAPVIDQPGCQIITLHEVGGVEGIGDGAAADDEGSLRSSAILAHEIKNPLAGIRGAAQLLARKVGGSDLALTGLIADEVDRIAKLIDQMQSLSRKTTPQSEPCNLHQAIRRASAVIVTGGDCPPIREEFDPSLPPVLGHADSLVQVLINLLANARDACRGSPEPQIIVRTRFASGLQLHSGERGSAVRLPIEVRVSDNGPGIESSLREHVFEPFVTSKKSGQGLGLALVRRLVRDMNGRVSHDRDEAAGWTHFRIHLPRADVTLSDHDGIAA